VGWEEVGGPKSKNPKFKTSNNPTHHFLKNQKHINNAKVSKLLKHKVPRIQKTTTRNFPNRQLPKTNFPKYKIPNFGEPSR
jgi:hypothetical protein